MLLPSCNFLVLLRDRKGLGIDIIYMPPTHRSQVCFRLLSCEFSLGVMNMRSFVPQHRSRKVFFARDPLGRRSLLMHMPSPELPYLLLVSVSVGKSKHYDFTELSTEYIYALDLRSLSRDPVTSFVTCLDRLPRVASSMDVSCPSPYVCHPAFLAFV